MEIRSVSDLYSIPTASYYDAVIFSCGSEPRSRHLPNLKLLEAKEAYGRILVLGHAGEKDKHYIANKEWYERQLRIHLVEIGTGDDREIYSFLTKLEIGSDRRLRLLIDYSSMPRAWYSAILNWCRMQENLACELDFIYTIGKYPLEWKKKNVQDIVSIPGCEGISNSKARTVAIFGLGYDETSAFSVYEWVEPTEVFAFLADPGASDESPRIAKERNHEFLSYLASGVFHLPLRSIETSYRAIGESVSIMRNSSTVVLAPLGPKPHVLACVLVAYRYNGTRCLQVLHKHSVRHLVEPTEDFVSTRVIFDI